MKDYTKLDIGQTKPAQPNDKKAPGKQNKPKNNNASIIILLALSVSAGMAMMLNEVLSDRPSINFEENYTSHTDYNVTATQTPQPLPTQALTLKADEFYKNPFPEIKQTLPVQTAYKLTNVERVAFSRDRSNLPANIAEYFQQLFTITDFLVVERLQNYQHLRTRQPLELSSYDIATSKLRAMAVPAQLKESHSQIISAIENQKIYFSKLEQGERFSASNPTVQAVNKSLISAWQIMATQYPHEEKRNLYSFEKHLCALDFI